MPDFKWFAANAAEHGNLIYYMNQSSTDPIAQDGPWGGVDNGYCAGLCVRWMRLAYADSDFQPASGYALNGTSIRYFNGTDYQAVLYQNKIRQFLDATWSDRRAEVQYALGLGQMLLGKELEEQSALRPNGVRLFRILKQSYGCYFVGLEGTRNGKPVGHAIALRHARPPGGKGPGVLHIFDPNGGHFAWQIESAQWTTILDSFLYFKGYDTAYDRGYLIGRATPPIC